MSGVYVPRVSPLRGRSSKPSRASAQPKVSASMVAAGAEVLWQSGAVEGQLHSDELLVVEIYQAMLKASL